MSFLCKSTPKKEELDMSEEGGLGLTVAEKFFGLILLIIGALATYYTFTSTQTLRDYTGFFGFLSIIVLALGIILVTAKTE
jgi:preprotein translocase subunit SecY